MNLSESERLEVAEILSRRANDIASFKMEHKDAPGSVELALSREIKRLRDLEHKIRPPEAGDEES